MKRILIALIASLVTASAMAAEPAAIPAAPVKFTTRTAQSGNWSDPATWTDRHVPAAGDFVQVRAGHRVVYDVDSQAAIRMVHVAGTLTFSRDKSTRLVVGLLKVQRGDEDVSEDGFTCAAHALVEQPDDSKGPTPVLEI